MLWVLVLVAVLVLQPLGGRVARDPFPGGSYSVQPADLTPLPYAEDVRLDPFGTLVVGFKATGGRLHWHAESLTGNYHRYCLFELRFKEAFEAKEPVPCWETREMAGRSGITLDIELEVPRGNWAVGVRCLDGSQPCNFRLGLRYPGAA